MKKTNYKWLIAALAIIVCIVASAKLFDFRRQLIATRMLTEFDPSFGWRYGNVEYASIAGPKYIAFASELTETPRTLSDSEIGLIQQFHGLRTLSIPGTAISDQGLAKLCSLVRLRHLDLQDCPITDAAVLHLLAIKNLEVLEINGTELSESAISSLTSGLPNTRIYSGDRRLIDEIATEDSRRSNEYWGIKNQSTGELGEQSQ
jgi:hypothetical protein